MNEKIDRRDKTERNESETSQGGVFYSCVHHSCMKVAHKIFSWLGLPSTPQLLSPGMQNVATIIILQCDRGRASDDIASVRNEYLHYQDKTIIILSLSIHDAEDHTKRYCIENMPPDRNITFLEIHQRANGDIHECMGNQFCREKVQSMLGIVKQKEDRSHPQYFLSMKCEISKQVHYFARKWRMNQEQVKRVRNWCGCWQTAYDIFTTISARVRRYLNCRIIVICGIVSLFVLSICYFQGILGIEHNSKNVSDFEHNSNNVNDFK